MKNTCWFSRISLIFALFLEMTACTKDRTVVLNGTIVSTVSGQPIPKARLDLEAYDGLLHDSSNPNVVDHRSYTTETDGTFHIVYDGYQKFENVSVWVNVNSYYPASFGAEAGETKDVGIIGLDTVILPPPPPLGVLRITAKNTKNIPREIWYKTEWYGVSLENHFWYFDFPLYVYANFPVTKTYRVEANRQVPVYWDFKAFGGSLSTYRDSVYCTEKDTTDFILEF